jgi:hypothetical protein
MTVIGAVTCVLLIAMLVFRDAVTTGSPRRKQVLRYVEATMWLVFAVAVVPTLVELVS